MGVLNIGESGKDNETGLTCLGVLNKGESDKDNKTNLKERGGIEMSTTVASIRDARSFAFVFTYLHLNNHPIDFHLWNQCDL